MLDNKTETHNAKIDAFIVQLKEQFSKVEKIDPCSPKVLQIRAMLKKLGPEYLQKIIDAKVRFMDTMARTELRNREGK